MSSLSSTAKINKSFNDRYRPLPFLRDARNLEVPRLLDEYFHVKERNSTCHESEHILALPANALVGWDYLDNFEALRENVAIQKATGRKEIPDPSPAADFCRFVTLRHNPRKTANHNLVGFGYTGIDVKA